MPGNLPDFLPGRLTLARGRSRDYSELAQFHYLPRPPATWADVWTIHYIHPVARPFDEAPRVVAVGVLSYSAPNCRARERFLGDVPRSRRERLQFVNARIRTISRVVVHPQFRALGLSTILVNCLCENCPTRYVEALAVMARAHPFFERAGMRRIDPRCADEPVYFIFDRQVREGSHVQRPV